MTHYWTAEIRVGLIIIVLALLSLFVLIPSGVTVPESVEIRVMSPDFWPLVVSIAAAIAGVFVLVGGVLELKHHHLTEITTTPDESIPVETHDNVYRPFGEAAVRVAVTVGVLFALYFAIPHIGIVVGCMALLIFLIRFTGEKRWTMIIAIAVILPLILYGFFVYVANVPMPLGVFEQFR